MWILMQRFKGRRVYVMMKLWKFTSVSGIFFCFCFRFSTGNSWRKKVIHHKKKTVWSVSAICSVLKSDCWLIFKNYNVRSMHHNFRSIKRTYVQTICRNKRNGGDSFQHFLVNNKVLAFYNGLLWNTIQWLFHKCCLRGFYSAIFQLCIAS